MLDIRKYETAAMLELSDLERAKIGQCAAALLERFDAISEINTDGIPPLVSVLDLHNILREDEAGKLITRDELMANAQEQYDGYFRVPGTIE